MKRKSAYSTDIRLRVVYQRIGVGHTFQTNLNIASSTAHHIFKQFELIGDVAVANGRSSRPELRVLNEQNRTDGDRSDS